VRPQSWQNLQYNGPFGAKYDYPDTHKPFSLVSDRTFDTSSPLATEKMKCGGRNFFGGFLAATAISQLRNSMDTIVQGFELLSDQLSG